MYTTYSYYSTVQNKPICNVYNYFVRELMSYDSLPHKCNAQMDPSSV